MALDLPDYDTLSDEARAELARRVPDVDPTIYASFVRPLLDSTSALAYSLTQLITDLETQLFPQTAEGEFLERWAEYEGLSRLAPTSASGSAIATGTLSTIIPAGTSATSSNGLSYTSSQVASIDSQGQSIASITRVETTATVTTNDNHNLASGLTLTISGADQTDYNGSFQITVTGVTTFTYQVANSPATPATGTLAFAGEFAIVPFTCSTTGVDGNLDPGAVLTLSSAISGVDNSLTVNANAIDGGASEEKDDALRERVILSRSEIEGVYTPSQVELAARSIAGNTRVFVVRPELSACPPDYDPGFVPTPGQCAVYILRDNDDNIIPTQSILDQTKQAIINDGSLPANSSENDLFVLAPTAVPVNFVFTSLSPNTATMRAAVTAQIQAFFADRVEFQTDILEAQYLGSIDQTQDENTGDRIASFALSSPSGTVTISDGEIGVLGTITFP